MEPRHSGGILKMLAKRYTQRVLLLLVVFGFALFLTHSVSLLADGLQLDPNGAGNLTQGTQTSCTGGTANFNCVDDGISSTTVPSTGGDYITFARSQQDSYQLSSATNVATATAVTVYMYHIEGSGNMQFQVSLFDATEATQYGTTQNVPIRTASQWDSVTFTGLTLNQSALDGLRVQTACNRASGGPATTCRDFALYAYVTYTQVQNVTVSSIGTQQNLDVGTTSAEVGGTFVIKENTASRNVTSVKLHETGTVNALTSLKNIRLYYDLDTTAPYDCAGETYSGQEPQFGATSTSFDAANGTTTFTGSVTASTTQTLCLYPVLDVATSSSAGQTIELQIDDPHTNVAVSGSGNVGPSSAVLLPGTTTLLKSNLDQIHYHWRNDDGSESGATSATNGSEDTTLDSISKLERKRLRLEVTNNGNKTSTSSVSILNPFTTGSTKTISPGTKRLLLVAIGSDDSSTHVDINSVTYGGQTLTQVADEQVTTTYSNGVWVGYLTETGIEAATNTSIVATWNGAPPDTAVLYSSVVLQHVDQVDPVPAWSGNTGTSISSIQPTTTVAVKDTDTAVYFSIAGSTGQSETVASGYARGTEEDSGTSPGAVLASAYKGIAGAGTEQPTSDWTSTQNRLAMVALTVRGGVRYQLEYAQKVTSCAAATGWSDVGLPGGDWVMSSTTNLTDGTDTTNVLTGALGAVTDANSNFLTPNGSQRDTTSQTGNIELSSTDFVELEYSVEPSAAATEGYAYCFRLTDGGLPLDAYATYPEATVRSDLTVSASGTQAPSVNIPTTDVYNGGLFSIVDGTAGTKTINSITITASGTVDLQNNISNIRLYYDTDTSAPYDCASESFSGTSTEVQYGSAVSGGFTATNTATFSDAAIASTTQSLCLYVVYDVGSGAHDQDTFETRIQDPSTDITVSSGSISPASLVDISGVTTFSKQNVDQIHYHWRNNDGSEALATSYTSGVEDMPATKAAKGDPIRLRLEVSNEGGATTTAMQYRLEWAQKISTCSAATSWTDVDTANDDWSMIDVANLTDGSDTTNVASAANGAVTDENTTFLTPNGGQKDTSSQTGNILLTPTEFTELEYAIEPTATSTEGATYCFRLTNAGAPLDTYGVYPEATIKLNTDFFVQRGTATTTGTSTTIYAGQQYVAPSASTSAFVRITNTHITGAGASNGAGNQNANNVTVYVLNPSNIENSITFARYGTSNDTIIDWEIVEYKGSPGGENEMIVHQQQYVTYGSTNTTVSTPTVSGVASSSKVVVFITGQGNADTGRNNYNTGLSTASYSATSSTATFERGESGTTVSVSYAVVEFTGSNWKIQRVEHTYSGAGTTETESIQTLIPSTSYGFVHSQKRVGAGLSNHADFGQEVWLSSVGYVSFRLDPNAGTPSGHVGVAWVIENTQTKGSAMNVTRSSGTQSGGTAPLSVAVPIGKTLDDLTVSSIFMSNNDNGTASNFPEPIIATRLISTTDYQLWLSNTGDTQTYRTAVVEWPTARRKLTQNYYRLYVDNDALTPTDPWSAGTTTDLGENTEMTGLDGPIGSGDSIRIRMTMQDSAASMVPGVDSFKLQYGQRSTTCSAISESEWHDLGAIGSTTALWRGHNGTPANSTALSGDPPTAGDLLISVSDVAGTYQEQNPTAFTPYIVQPGEDVEFDWAIEDNNAPQKQSYCFRMVESDGTLLSGYSFYPTVRTIGYGAESQNWRWYTDGTNETPTVAPGLENVAPSNIAFDDTLQLRLTLKEVNGAAATTTKFKLQFSEFSDFSTSTDVASSGGCGEKSLFCYADGGGNDNATITTALLSDADTCIGSTGNGCGTHNESPTTTANFEHHAGAATEFAFAIKNAGARPNRTYFFRVYDVAHNETVPLASGHAYPSLSTEGASLTFTVSGLPAGTTTEGVVLGATTTPVSLSFGSLQNDAPKAIAHRLTVNTNATEGYKILMYSTGALSSTVGSTIQPITSTNASPAGWASACSPSATSCVGYHVGDDVLEGGSTRFSALDTYAALDTTPQEVAYSSLPVVNESNDIVYRAEVRQLQEAGEYDTGVAYIAVPVF